MNIESKIKDIVKQILLIFLYIFLVVGLQVMLLKLITSKNLLLANFSYILIELIVLAVFIFIFRKTIIPDFYDFKKNGKKYLKENYKYWLYGLLVMYVCNIIISSFIGMPSNEEANREMLEMYPIYSIVTMIILGPITEELLTRAPLKDTFKNPYIYFILSAFFFGSLHLISIINSQNLLEVFYIIPYGALGFCFAKIYYNSNNIWTNITIHAFHNFIAILIIFLGWLL